ncbi:MAG: hypothetical protein NTX91_00080, partial [candidate division SR1 bacterium]|nr:hypothetical protein [candidate division SR1 bacterium]
EESKQQAPAAINLEKFVVQQAQSNGPKISLGDSGIHITTKNKVYIFNYRRMFVMALIAIAVFGSLALLLGLYNRYLTIASQPIIPAADTTYINDYKSVQNILRTTLGMSDYQKYSAMGMDGINGKTNVDTILNSTFNYVSKKELLQNNLNTFSPVLIGNKQKLEDLKQEVTKYGFFSRELFDLLQNEEYVTSIKESLLSLEMIKFSSAIKVFSYLDTFISTVANVLNIPTATAEAKMTTLADRGEKDIALYLNNCYLNPYEIDYDCNLVGDFDRYYSVIQPNDTGLDRPFFKKIMSLIDIKLEQTALPSFAITFQKFDPTQKQISFNVEVNTFAQDEAALTKKGIINPHIFIVTNLLNLIKQSLYVLSENVDAKTLKITPKTIKIGSTVFTVNNSTMDFILPIQQSTQREITDYTSQDLLPTNP